MSILFNDDTPAPAVAPGSPLVAFVVNGRPQQRGSKVSLVPTDRQGNPYRKNGRIIVSTKDSNEDNSKVWMGRVADSATNAWGYGRPLIDRPILLGIRFYFNRPKSHYGTGNNSHRLKPSAPKLHAQSPDLAKLIRCLEDALTGVVWLDDKLVCRYTGDTGRYWTDSQERAEVSIYCLEE